MFKEFYQNGVKQPDAACSEKRSDTEIMIAVLNQASLDSCKPPPPAVENPEVSFCSPKEYSIICELIDAKMLRGTILERISRIIAGAPPGGEIRPPKIGAEIKGITFEGRVLLGKMQDDYTHSRLLSRTSKWALAAFSGLVGFVASPLLTLFIDNWVKPHFGWK